MSQRIETAPDEIPSVNRGIVGRQWQETLKTMTHHHREDMNAAGLAALTPNGNDFAGAQQWHAADARDSRAARLPRIPAIPARKRV